MKTIPAILFWLLVVGFLASAQPVGQRATFVPAPGQRFLGITNGYLDTNALTFSPDGRWLAASGNLYIPFDTRQEVIALFDLTRDGAVKLVKVVEPVSVIAFSPDSKLLAFAEGEVEQLSDIHLVEVANPTDTRRLKGHTDWITHLEFSPDGKRLLSASRDATVRLWDVAQGKESVRVVDYTGKDERDWRHIRHIKALTYHPDGNRVLLHRARKLCLFDLERRAVVEEFEHDGRAMSLSFSRDGQRLVIGDSPVQLLDVASKKAVFNLENYRHPRLSPDGKLLATDYEGRIHVHEIDTGRLLARLTANFSVVAFNQRIVQVERAGPQLAFSPNGRVVAGQAYHGIVLWDLDQVK
jgi:WD40 repeat protein